MYKIRERLIDWVIDDTMYDSRNKRNTRLMRHDDRLSGCSTDDLVCSAEHLETGAAVQVRLQ
jgi:hypothetical protein